MTQDEQKYVEELQAENVKLRAELEDSKASDAESLKLYRAARDRADAGILKIQEFRNACFLALKCIRERCLESLTPPGEGVRLYYTGIAGEAHDAIEKALGPVSEKRNADCECGRPAHEHGGCRNYRPKGA